MCIGRWVAVAAVIVGSSSTAASQDPVRPIVPQIVTSGSGEVRITPDRATVSIGVQSRAATAADASAENSRKQRAVIDAIRARGIPADQISTSGFNVIPETRYDREGQAAPRTTSYLVMNTVVVELRRVDQVGPVIDAALAAGANQIHSLAFGVANPDSARRAALGIAVARARADAEVMARAAGGTLGSLIEMSAGGFEMPPPIPVMRGAVARAAQEAVPIEPGQQEVRAMVTGRWHFVSGSAPR